MLKNKYILWLLLAVVLLSGCGAKKQEKQADLKESSEKAQTANYRTTVVERGDYIVESKTGAIQYNPVIINLTWDKKDCRYQEYHVKTGDTVKKGDLLISFVSEESTLALEEKQLALEQLEKEYTAGKERRERDIDTAEKNLWKYSSYAYTRAKKEIELMELDLESFCYEMDFEKEQIEKAIAELEIKPEDLVLTAPCDGIIDKMPYADLGDKVPVGEPLIQMFDPATVVLGAENQNKVFAYGQKVTISSRERSVSGYVAAAGNALPIGYDLYYMVVRLDEGSVLDSNLGLSLQISGDTVTVHDVLLAHRSAFTLEGGKYYVQILEDDGSVHRRPVQIGSTNNNGNGEVVWILDGVEEGDTLILSF